MKCKAYNLFFETIGNKTRLKILELLHHQSLSVNEICKELKEEQSKISHNLKILTDCHFLKIIPYFNKRFYNIAFLNKVDISPGLIVEYY